jgi:hypothetical protein
VTVKICASCLQAFDGEECGACAAERRFAARHRPVLYLEQLPPWDGEKRVTDFLDVPVLPSRAKA